MENKKQKRRRAIILALINLSFIGFILCWVVDRFVFGKEQRIMDAPFWSKVMIVTMAVFVFTLMVLIPIEILYFKRKERQGKALRKMTFSDLAGLPFGAYNPNAKIPGWIKAPILTLLFVLIGIFVLFALMGLIVYLFAPAG